MARHRSCPHHAKTFYSQRLRVHSNDDETITMLFDLYADYINTEKERAHDVYNLAKLERLAETISKKTKAASSATGEDEAAQVDNNFTANAPVPMLVPHEPISKSWRIEPGLRTSIPRRLLKPTVFESIANLASCRISFNAGSDQMSVKGDNDQSVDETVEKLDNLVKAFSLCYAQPSIYNFYSSEAEPMGVSFRVLGLGEDETYTQKFTTVIHSIGSLHLPQLSDFGVVVLVNDERGMTNKSSSNITKPKTSPLRRDLWHDAPICPHGKQPREHPRYPFPTEPAPATVAEWIEKTPHTTYDPSKPLKEVNELPANVSPAVVQVNYGSSTGISSRKRYTRNRKAPGMPDISEDDSTALNSHAFDLGEDNTQQNLIEIEVDTHETEMIPNSTPIADSALSSYQNPSHSDGRGSALPDQRPATPSTMLSAAPQDLLTGAEEPAAKSCLESPLTPTPKAAKFSASVASPRSTLLTTTRSSPNSPAKPACASNPPRKPSRTSKSSSPLQDRHQQPAWMAERNPNAKAKAAQISLSLIRGMDAVPNAQPLSYLAAAKQGSARHGTPASSSQVRERLAAGSELQPRRFHKTMNQKMARSIELNIIQATKSAIIQLLQPTRAFRGIVRLEVDIGHILVKNQTLPLQIATGRTFSMNDWSLLFSTQGGTTQTVFTHMLPILDKDIGFLAALKHDSRPIFADEPSECSVRFHLLCGTRLADEEVALEISNSGSVQVLGTEHLVGAMQWHFPKRQWDSRIAVKIREQIQDYQDAVAAITKTWTVIPSVKQKTAQISAELGNSGLYFKRAYMLREASFRCLTDPDMVMSCTEVQHLGPAKERTRYDSIQRDPSKLRIDGDLWWEVRLRSSTTNQQLQENENLSLGNLANWKAEDITQGDVVKRFHALGADVVSQIDGIGVTVNKPSVNKVTVATSVADRSELLSRASEAASYW
ncbi:MAG: hypothetical protein Q9201_003313 [Fulgogasparrea decipioides]